MTHWNFIGELKKKRKEIELKIQHLLLPDSKAGKIGVKFQFPDSRSRGGNSTTGQTARVFFANKELRERLLVLVPDDSKAVVATMMQNIAVILRYIYCSFESLRN